MTYNFLKKVIACNCLLILNLQGMDQIQKLMQEKDYLEKSIQATQRSIDRGGCDESAADTAIRAHLDSFMENQSKSLQKQT